MQLTSQFKTQANYEVTYRLGIFYLPNADVFFKAAVFKHLNPHHSVLASVLITPYLRDERFVEHRASYKIVHDF